jgi:predicted nucleic acid-binding protein
VAVSGWILDKSAAVRVSGPETSTRLDDLAGLLYLCPIGELEQLYSARSSRHYDELKSEIHASFEVVSAPSDVLQRALALQQDLAHHHGMWHRTQIGDLLIAETALYHDLGVVHVDGHFDRIAEVRPLIVRRLIV